MNATRILTPTLLAVVLSAPVPVLGLLASLRPAVAQAAYEQPPEGEGPYERHPAAVKAIRELKSPYCPGLMLEVCPSPEGAALRDSIEALADSGWVAEDIVDWVIGNHGETYRALPPREGAGLLAWLMPPAAVLLGLGLVVLALRKMRRLRGVEGADADEVSPEDEERLREALSRLEEEAPFL